MIQGERYARRQCMLIFVGSAGIRFYYISVGHRGLFELGLDTSAGDLSVA